MKIIVKKFACAVFVSCALLSASSEAQTMLCGTAAGDVCYLTPTELQAIQDNPVNFKSIFINREAQFVADLGASFQGITEQGAALAFAAVVAYELKGYRSVTNAQTPAPASRNLPDLMAVPALVCNEYVSLAIQLFYLAYPQTDASPIKIEGIGLRRDSPVSNHAQIIATGTGVPMLIDPDLGLIANVTLNDLLNHIAPKAIFVKTNRNNATLQSFLGRVQGAISNGKYDENYLIYSFLASDINQAGGPKHEYAWSDFTSSVARGPNGRFWYTTGAGALWEINQGGIVLASSGGTKSIATGLGGNAIYELTTSGSVYQKTSGSDWTLVSNTGVASIASGLNGQIILLLTTAGDLWNISSTGWAYASPGIADIATGLNQTGTYERTGSGSSNALNVYTSSGWIPISNSGIARIVAEKNRQGIYFLTGTGDLYRINNSGTVTFLIGGATDIELGAGGLTINILKNNGTIWQGDLQPTNGAIDWNTGTFNWTQLWVGNVFNGISLTFGGTTLDATRADGQHLTASASTY